MKRLSAERGAVEDEVARQFCGEVLGIRRAAAVAACKNACPRTEADNQVVPYGTGCFKQTRILKDPRLDLDRVFENLFNSPHAQSLSTSRDCPRDQLSTNAWFDAGADPIR
ncbi:hypothetical protein MHPYR_280019 [uncultured Mycobacterium sp.]|uniref:Uncharacterized protein n=1 Tax=uncultured Mycobacterium sp. TaxID=171292 RepID=A0A1Y5PI75_9MYCO|nr:hypothetical protein MHPYR_280019 [uncultured Mycobacterium sp.]